MKVTLIDHTQRALEKLIYTRSTRLTQGHDTRSQIDKMTADEKLALVKEVARTIPSSWEFVNYTFEIKEVTRAFTHQFVRTRTGSYAQQTMRMLNKECFSYETPDTVNLNQKALERYQECMSDIQSCYDELIDMGIPIEDARGVLPTNIHTNIIAQFNLRTLADMAKSRTGGRTQNEYRTVFEAMAKEVIAIHPWTKSFLFPSRWGELHKLEGNMNEMMYATGDERDKLRTDCLKIIDKCKKGEI